MKILWALPVCFALTSCSKPPLITLAEYDRVNDGISLAAVEGIVGAKCTQKTEAAAVGVAPASAACHYRNPDGSIASFFFMGDRLSGKSQKDLK